MFVIKESPTKSPESRLLEKACIENKKSSAKSPAYGMSINLCIVNNEAVMGYKISTVVVLHFRNG